MADMIRDDVSKNGPDFYTSGGRVKPADTIRDELARVISDALDAHMGEPPADEPAPSDYSAADAILSSPVVARIRAEVISEWRAANPGVPIDEHDRQIRAEAWDEGYIWGTDRWLGGGFNAADAPNPYRGPQSIHSFPEGDDSD